MSQPTKVQMKIGDAEFNAEGSEELVNRQFQMFLDALASRGQQPTKDLPPPPPPPPGGGSGNGDQLPPEVIHQAFIVNGQDISLRALPGGDDPITDALIMLLYGYRHLNERLDVSAGELTEAVRASGIPTTRIDRIIGRSAHMRRAGSKRGTRYSLNNQGVARAELVLREMYM